MSNISVVPEGKICDYVDGKFRNDTDEEYVRQTIERRLVDEHRYPATQIAVEFTLQNGSKRPRAGSAKLLMRRPKFFATPIQSRCST